jgi:hypothetical protein
MENIDRQVPATEAPQMKVMGQAGGSRTTSGDQESNTMLASRADQPLGPMGNAAGFPNTRDAASSYGYGQENSGDYSMLDLKSMIQRYPIPAFLIGVGLGYLLSSPRMWR